MVAYEGRIKENEEWILKLQSAVEEYRNFIEKKQIETLKTFLAFGPEYMKKLVQIFRGG